jgi:hypothetical protein
MMLRHLFHMIFFLLPAGLLAQGEDWVTPYERSGYIETATYDETINYCQRLASACDSIHYESFGLSPQGRDLPLMIIDREGLTSPADVRAGGRAILMIQAGIHPGEIDGNDAGLMFFRDMAIRNGFQGMLDNLTILFIPIFSVDGHERSGPYNRINQDGPVNMGWRANAQNLNLNRDYLKADSPEMQYWLRLFQKWLPDFVVDIHVTDGADYQYVSTYEAETRVILDEGISEWTREVFVPFMEKEMEDAGFPVFQYVAFRRWHDPRSGLRHRVPTPRLSHGYTILHNRPCLLVENHSLKDFKTRVTCTYEQFRVWCSIINDEAATLVRLNEEADRNAMSDEFLNRPLGLDWRVTSDSSMVKFRGVEYEVIESDLTGGPWFIYHSDKPVTFDLPFFNKLKVDIEVQLPEAYIIPPEWMEVIDRLELHGVQYKEMLSAETLMVETYRFSDPDFARSPYEGRFRVEAAYTTQVEELLFPKGSIIVPLRQRASKVIANIFEPDAPDSYLHWGFFNAIFEQKEYSETYVMERVAREMIQDDPDLNAEFDKLREENPGFAENQWAQLNWFYSRSPWWDARKNLYPVARINDPDLLEKLMSNTHD